MSSTAALATAISAGGLDLSPLEYSAREEIVRNHMAQFKKVLDPTQMQLLLNNAGSNSMQWLALACEELRVFGAFETITAHIQSLPPTVTALLAKLLWRSEVVLASYGDGHMAQLLRDMLLLLHSSERGLLEIELREILHHRQLQLQLQLEAQARVKSQKEVEATKAQQAEKADDNDGEGDSTAKAKATEDLASSADSTDAAAAAAAAAAGKVVANSNDSATAATPAVSSVSNVIPRLCDEDWAGLFLFAKPLLAHSAGNVNDSSCRYWLRSAAVRQMLKTYFTPIVPSAEGNAAAAAAAATTGAAAAVPAASAGGGGAGAVAAAAAAAAGGATSPSSSSSAAAAATQPTIAAAVSPTSIVPMAPAQLPESPGLFDASVTVPYARILADYFEAWGSTGLTAAGQITWKHQRYLDEYPAALLRCRDYRRIRQLMCSQRFGWLPYGMRYRVVQAVRCRARLTQGQTPVVGRSCRMCTACSMKSTFSEKRMNRMCCCVCGGPTFSLFTTIGGKNAVRLQMGESEAMMCRQHDQKAYMMAGPMVPVTCMVCKVPWNPSATFPMMVCQQCSVKVGPAICTHLRDS